MSYLDGLRFPLKPFSDVVSKSQYGLSVVTDEAGEIPMLKMNSISDKGLSLEGLGRISCDQDTLKKYRIHRGDLLLNRTNSRELVGKACVVKQDEDIVFASYLVRFVITPDTDPFYVGYWFQDERAKHRLKAISTAGVSQSNINPTVLKKALQLPFPALPEQQKIAEILGACDEAIEAQVRLISQQEQRKKGLMQKLLTGEVRFFEFESDLWQEYSLSDQLKETPRKVEKPNCAFKAVGVRCHARGIFLKPDMLPGDIALTELFEIKAGDVVVNISFAWEHAIAVADESHDGALVSHRFPTFVCRPNVAASNFFKYFVQLPRMRYDLKCVSPGGAGRNRVLNKKDFKKLRYSFPSFDEQVRIGDFLDAISGEIALQQKQLDQLKQQKKALMQKLLTGEVRVKV